MEASPATGGGTVVVTVAVIAATRRVKSLQDLNMHGIVTGSLDVSYLHVEPKER